MPLVDFQLEDNGATGNVPIRQADGSWAMRPPSELSGLPNGADPWTYVRLASDFSTTSATAVDVTGLAFTPAANKVYHIRGQFLLRTAATATGPRPGCAWPSGTIEATADMRCASAVNADVLQRGNNGAAVLTPVGGLPVTTGSFPGYLEATMVMGAAPSGTFRVQLASETALTGVTMKIGSWLAYRTI